MPIRNLTDRPAAFPRIGELRKGAPKDKDGKRPGADLKYFRFTPTDPKDTALLTSFNSAVAEKPTLIYVLLPYQKPEDNLEAWQEAWTAGSLQHRCDGVTVVLELDKAGKHFILNSGTPCPGGCKATGRLSVIVPALKRAGIVTVLTTSKNDLLNLSRSLDAAYQLRGDLRGIPFALSRVPRMISTPSADGKRARREKWLLNLEIAPQWFERELARLQVSALPQVVESPYLLESGFDEEDEDDARQVDTATGEVTDAHFSTPEDLYPSRAKAEEERLRSLDHSRQTSDDLQGTMAEQDARKAASRPLATTLTRPDAITSPTIPTPGTASPTTPTSTMSSASRPLAPTTTGATTTGATMTTNSTDPASTTTTPTSATTSAGDLLRQYGTYLKTLAQSLNVHPAKPELPTTEAWVEAFQTALSEVNQHGWLPYTDWLVEHQAAAKEKPHA